MSRISTARSALHVALSTVFDEPIETDDGQLIAFRSGRVSKYPPPNVVAPCVWIEQPSGSTGVGGGGTAVFDFVRFAVAVVYDGTDRAQVAGLDELVARVWDLARRAGEPESFTPGPLDVGGPNLRATYVDVAVPIRALTLCGSTTATEPTEVAHG